MTNTEQALAKTSSLSLGDRWFAFRNRMLRSPRFQRWAAAFWLTRPIARRRASALFDLCAGFVYAQVLYACVRLRVFDAIADEPRSVSDLAHSMDLSLDATRRLLDAAVSIRLVERRGVDHYGLGVHGASLLGNPSVARMIEHHEMLYRDLTDPVALLRGEVAETATSSFWRYDRDTSDDDVAGYSRLMASSQELIAADILEAYAFEGHRRLLDIGGGEGAFVGAVARAAPDLELALFDLPSVAARARVRLAERGLGTRVEAHGGDVFTDPLPHGADLVSLVRVVHDHDDDDALAILGAARRALSAGGTLLVAEPMSSTPGAEAMGDAYFGMYLLAMGRGRPRTARHLEDLCRRAGFRAMREVPTRRPMLARMLVATAE